MSFLDCGFGYQHFVNFVFQVGGLLGNRWVEEMRVVLFESDILEYKLGIKRMLKLVKMTKAFRERLILYFALSVVQSIRCSSFARN